MGPGKFALFAAAPLVALLAAAEIAARVTEWAVPQVRSLPLPEQDAGILLPHPTLFWAPTPNMRRRYMDVNNGFKTNRYGQRSPNFEPEKPAHEFRILSLGESTTFGLNVTNDETYSAQLEKLLNRDKSPLKYRVLNCGVPAYTSFQSLLYLKTVGAAFKPDLVLFYHEVNDYLPTALRSGETELGLELSDRELFESNRASLERRLMAHCAAFRAVRYWFARREFAKFQQGPPVDPFADIGMAGVPFTARLVDAAGKKLEQINEKQLPIRVRPAERLANLRELAAFCRQQNFRLVVIHPAYADTKPHECILTDFCRDEAVAMFEAYPVLHPSFKPGEPPFPGDTRRGFPPGYELFYDGMHPLAAGHRRLAEALAAYLHDAGMLER